MCLLYVCFPMKLSDPNPLAEKFTRQRRCPSFVLIIEIPAGDAYKEDAWVQVHLD